MMFSIDTSGFIEGWNRFYCPDVFPSIWEQMAQAAGSGVIVAVQDVLEELKQKDDAVREWAEQHVQFLPLEADVQDAAATVLRRFPTWVGAHRSRSFADPFAVGLALARGLRVVTMERSSSTPSERKPKIPDVCAAFDIRCYSLVEMFRELGWQA